MSTVLLMIMTLSACTTEYNLATQQEETLIYGADKEIAIGESVAAQVERQYKFVTDVDINERVERILDRIVEVCDRKDIVYFIKVIDEDEMNAVSLPGGYVYVFKGLLDKIRTDDELAAVIAHEVGHITAKHGIKRLQASYGAMLAQMLAVTAAPRTAAGVDLALTSLFLEYSQQDEFEADRLSVKYLKKAGFDPGGAPSALKKLLAQQEKEPTRRFSYWRTHPNLSQRVSAVNKEVTGKLEFKDYINLIGN